MLTSSFSFRASRVLGLGLGLGLFGAVTAAQAQVDGYQFAPSTTTFTPVSATAIPVPSIQADDAVSGTLPIGFTFVFDGTPYQNFVASSNGLLSFNTGASTNFGNGLMTGAATERPFIAPFWDDLDGRDASAAAAYILTGTAPNRVLTMEWRNWMHYAGPGPALSFQVKLYETTNRVEMVYRQEATPITNTTASIGLAGVGMGTGSFLSVSDAVAAPSVSSTTSNDNIVVAPPTGQVYAFTPPVPSACPTPRNLQGLTSTTTSAQLQWTTTGGGGTFTVIYGPVGFNPATSGTTLAGITGNSTVVTGLTAGGSYQFYVMQICGGTAGNSNLAGPAGFTLGPGNDECVGAIPLTIAATCTPTTGTVAAATQSLPPSTICNFATTAQDVWYSFVAAATSQAVVTTANSNAVVQLYSGSCGALQSIICTSLAAGVSQTTLVGGLTVGQTYYIRLYNTTTGATGTAASFTLCVTPAPPAPANDDCAGAINVPVQYGGCVGQTVGNNTAATASSGVAAPTCGTYQGGDIWFKVTVPGSGNVTVQTVPPTAGSAVTQSALSVYSGTCGALVLLGCDSFNGTPFGYSLLALTGRTPGEVLYIRVWSSSFGTPTTGPIAVCVTSTSNCASPLALAATSVTDTEATLTWTDGGGGPTGNFEVEYGPQGFIVGQGSMLNGITTPTYHLTGLTPATTYCFYVRKNCGTASGSSTSVGPVCFTTPLTVPANDDPCGAVNLTAASVTGTTAGSTTSAQTGINLPACAPAQLPKDVWYSFVATTNAQSFASPGTTLGMLRVFTTPSCSAGPFQQVFCRASTASGVALGTVTVPGLTVGQRYYVAVSGFTSGDVGPFTFTSTATTVSAATAAVPAPALLVYPNPSGNGQLTLRLPTDHAAGTAGLFNALGQCAARQLLPAHQAEQTISTKALAPGVYTLRVELGQQVLTQRVVLQ